MMYPDVSGNRWIFRIAQSQTGACARGRLKNGIVDCLIVIIIIIYLFIQLRLMAHKQEQ
jgi:hypothetical protein